MKQTLITSVEHLKTILSQADVETEDFALCLEGGAFSRKEIYYHNVEKWEDDTPPQDYIDKYLNKFEITNCIDDTTQILSEEDIMNPDLTNIGVGIKQKAFYHLEYD